MKFSWELEEIDPSAESGNETPYIVKRLREDDEEGIVFKKVFKKNWREAIATIRNSLDLLEKTFMEEEQKSKKDTDKKT